MGWGTLTLIGSGELGPSLGKTYRRILAAAPAAARGVFLDTPAGFELNAAQIAVKVQTYFAERIGVKLEVAGLQRADLAPEALARCVALLERADFVFAGPGSPTYAARVWRATPAPAVLARRLQAGAHVAFASAAAIVAGRHVLPVYEIYKVGQDPFWDAGLDLLGVAGLELAVVPHWNNAEGGTYDTRFCFMGAERFAVLEALLPETAVIMGVDEYTACTFDLARGMAEVSGAGGVTLRQGGRDRHYPSGETFALAEIGAGGGTPVALAQEAAAPSDPPPDEAAAGESVDGRLAAALVDALVTVREELRAQKQWALADQVRDRLSALGVRLGDGHDGTGWTWDREA